MSRERKQKIISLNEREGRVWVGDVSKMEEKGVSSARPFAETSIQAREYLPESQGLHPGEGLRPLGSTDVRADA